MESLLSSQPGVIEADASFLSGSAVVVYDPERTTPGAIVEAVNARTLYRARLPVPGEAVVPAARTPWGLYAGAALVVMVSGGIGFAIWRRRSQRAPTDRER